VAFGPAPVNRHLRTVPSETAKNAATSFSFISRFVLLGAVSISVLASVGGLELAEPNKALKFRAGNPYRPANPRRA